MYSDYIWAKKCEKNGKFYWLSLTNHSVDVKGVSGYLYEYWLGEAVKELLEWSLDENSKGKSKNLVEFLGLVHDLGKYIPAFEIKKGYKNSKDLDYILLERLEKIGFTGISSEVFASPEKSHHSLGGHALLKSYGVNDDICSIVGGHHGKPVDYIENIKNNFIAYQKNYFQSENSNSEIYKKWKEARFEFFNWALKTCGFNSVDELPKIKQPGQVILSGILIMADWIASNENYFELFDIDNIETDINQIDRLNRGFEKWYKNDIWEPNFNSDIEEIYNDRFKSSESERFIPNEVQLKICDLINETDEPGIVILEAPMGIGKTEASLVVSELLAQKTGRNGIFFGLPTQATSDGIFPRIKNWIEKLDDDKKSLRLSHGKSQLNDIYNSLAKDINIDEKDSNVFVNQWFNGKKSSALDDFVVGTVDHFLMVALKQKHLALRHLGFAKKVVIIDEVHAYDSYMSQYMLKAINWMGAYGVPMIILSATLPETKRIEMIKSYLKGKGVNLKEMKNLLENDLKTEAYPLITYTDGGEIKQFRDFSKTQSKEINIVKVEIEKEEDYDIEVQKEYEEMKKIVKNSILKDGIVGIIVNTVDKAQKIAEKFSLDFGDENVEILHSRFIDTHRKENETRLLKTIGKNGNRPSKRIIVGTQVMEQSLDIDFDVMISELAPMDLLIQRMGRLHRHNRNRPKNLKEPKFYVIGINENLDFYKGSMRVYGGYLLSRTQFYLKEKLFIPEDISVLVQKVYDFENNNFYSDDLNFKFENYRDEYLKFIEIKKNKAQNYILDNPIVKDKKGVSLIGWLKNSNPNEHEEYATAQVRDIIDTIEVIAVKKCGNGYAFFDDENVDISSKIDDFNICKKLATNTLKLPNIFSYKIDSTIATLEKYNIKNLVEWQNSTWLKGSLGIIFDENNEFIIDNHKILYDKKYGLKERM